MNQFVSGTSLTHLVMRSFEKRQVSAWYSQATDVRVANQCSFRLVVRHHMPTNRSAAKPQNRWRGPHPASCTTTKVTFPAVNPLPPTLLAVPTTFCESSVIQGMGLAARNSSWKTLSSFSNHRSLPMKLQTLSVQTVQFVDRGGLTADGPAFPAYTSKRIPLFTRLVRSGALLHAPSPAARKLR